MTSAIGANTVHKKRPHIIQAVCARKTHILLDNIHIPLDFPDNCRLEKAPFVKYVRGYTIPDSPDIVQRPERQVGWNWVDRFTAILNKRGLFEPTVIGKSSGYGYCPTGM